MGRRLIEKFGNPKVLSGSPPVNKRRRRPETQAVNLKCISDGLIKPNGPNYPTVQGSRVTSIHSFGFVEECLLMFEYFS